jgi:hypothetical protein
VKNLKVRVVNLERRRPGPDPLAGLSFDELWGIVCSHEWTDAELDAPCDDPLFRCFTYRQLIDIARGVQALGGEGRGL